MRHLLAVATACLLLTAEAPPPPGLAAYIRDGHFDPGDYGWMRGRFADATPAQKLQWQALWSWRERCRAEQFTAIRSEFARRGIVASSSVESSNGTGVCGSVGYALPEEDSFESWPAFQAAVSRATPIARAIIWSAALAQDVANPGTTKIASTLIARPMTDQVLRQTIAWDTGEVTGAPPLDEKALHVAHAIIWVAIARRDQDNTAWLKRIVAANGWPTIGKVGKRASEDAWLLVQHADEDPVFQFDMLNKMKPLVRRGDVSKDNYAYLYDRVMLRIAGKQRYGSQLECRGGKWVPQPLENPSAVDTLRHSMGMEDMAAYTVQLLRVAGPCPPDVIPPSPAPR